MAVDSQKEGVTLESLDDRVQALERAVVGLIALLNPEDDEDHDNRLRVDLEGNVVELSSTKHSEL